MDLSTKIDLPYGFFISKESTISDTIHKLIYQTEYNAAQIFLSSPKQKKIVKVDKKDAEDCRELLTRFSGTYICIHNCLLYNLAGSADGKKDIGFRKKLGKTIDAWVSELDTAVCISPVLDLHTDGSSDTIGGVVHIGSYPNKREGIQLISRTIECALTNIMSQTKEYAKRLNITPEEFIKRRKIILEN